MPLKMQWRAATIALVVFLSGCGRTVAPHGEATFDEEIEHYRLGSQTPGLFVSLREGSDVVFEKGFGETVLGSGSVPDADTVFRVGSIAKVFLGMALFRLEEQKKLRVSDSAATWLPDRVQDGEITLLMLARHTSGIPEYVRYAKEVLSQDPSRHWSRDELVSLVKDIPGEFSPGSGWEYSNTNSLLLAEALERAAGGPMEEFYAKEIFAPLALDRTGLLNEPALPHPHASGYQLGNQNQPTWWRGRGNVLHDVTARSPSIWQEAGAMYSTAEDLHKLARALAEADWVSRGLPNPRTEFVATGHPDFEYGACMAKFGPWLGHSGQVHGYSAVMAFHPAKRRTLVILANLYADGNNRSVAEHVFRLLLSHPDSPCNEVPET